MDDPGGLRASKRYSHHGAIIGPIYEGPYKKDHKYISGPKVSTHPTGRKIEQSCGVAEGPEVLFTLARLAE